MEHWQYISTLIIVAAASFYLLGRMRAVWSGKSAGCGSGASGCGSCPSAEPKTPIISLDDMLPMTGGGERAEQN